MKNFLKKILPVIVVAVWFLVIALYQFLYTEVEQKQQQRDFALLTPEYVKTFNLGLDSATASFLWIDTMFQLPFMQKGSEVFYHNFELVTSLDPQFSFPYWFTTLVLPAARGSTYEQRVERAIEIGKEGVKNADPDWRIPFYLASTYFIEKDDIENAVKYYDIAANTPGAPPEIKRFASSYGLAGTLRDQVRKYWEQVYLTTDDPTMKERAEGYLERIQIYEILEKAAEIYQARFDECPEDPEDLVEANILKIAPEHPLGYEFYFTDKCILNVR